MASFWDFIAPDIEEFKTVVGPTVPEVVFVGPVALSREQLLAAAYVLPGSAAGLSARLYYEASRLSVGRAQAQVLQAAVEQQGTAGGFGAGGGFGGSFGWTSKEIDMVLVIPNVYRVAIEGTSGGQAVTNVVGVRGSGPGLALEAAQAVRTAWKVAQGPLANLTAAYSLLGFRALDLSSINGSIADVPDSTPGGIASVIKATNGSCALIKWNGGTRSRSSRGRMYYGPLTEGAIQSDGRTLEVAVQALYTTAFNNFRSSISSSGFNLCVISPTTSAAFDVSSVAVEPIIATQRRRIRG